MSELTVKGKLPIGVTVDGKVYKDFSIRPGTLLDSVNAADSINLDRAAAHFSILANSQIWDGIKPEQYPDILIGMYKRAQEESGGASNSVLRYATMAQRVSFDGLPQKQVTTELLMGLFERDAITIELAADEVEKKLDALSSS